MLVPVPKPPKREKKAPKPLQRKTRLKQFSARRRAEIPLRKSTREAVIERDRGRCRCCGEQVGTYGHCHEIVFRSQGGSPLELANVVLLCARCHAKVHAYTLTITPVDDALGANGDLIFDRAERDRHP